MSTPLTTKVTPFDVVVAITGWIALLCLPISVALTTLTPRSASESGLPGAGLLLLVFLMLTALNGTVKEFSTLDATNAAATTEQPPR